MHECFFIFGFDFFKHCDYADILFYFFVAFLKGGLSALRFSYLFNAKKSPQFYLLTPNFSIFHKFFLSIIIFPMATHKTVDETTLENLLYLSRLSPESTDMATLKKQVDEIVGYFDILSKYDDSENPYDAYPSTEAEKLREDEIVAGLDIPDVKKVTDKFMDGYFQVPKVLGEGA